MNGVCSYGCGLEYPATAEHNDADGNGICDVCYFCAGEHVFENGFDPCFGGECSVCWTFVAGEHSYDNACDVDCNVCGENREVEHNVVHVPAFQGTCIETGHIEYWYCKVCGSAWLDAECTLNTNLKAVILPGSNIHPESEIVHVEAKEATCFEDGNIEYWHCNLCTGYFSDKNMTWRDAIEVEETVIPAAHTFENPCDTYCVVCEEDVRDPNHTLTYVPAVDAIDCQTPGNIEHWYCEVCEGYFADEKGINQYNPWYIPVTADCVRPEGAADCAIVPCEVCGEELYGYGEHDVLACKGGTCGKCGDYIEGYGCANYDTPACMDGVCYYCGGFVAGFGHENGSWAPCCDGECSYGCGLKYPATEEHVDDDGDEYCDNCWNHLNHVFENGFDPCFGGECSVCWSFVEGAHDFEDKFTVDVKPTEETTGSQSRHCKNCEEVTDVTEIPVINRGDVNGDNRVNSRDLLALKKYLANAGTIKYTFNADIDGNGRINSTDTMRLNKILKP